MTHRAHLTGTEGGVTVLVPAGGGKLITFHIVFDETTGMSATMKTFERDAAEKPKAHTIRAPETALAPGVTRLLNLAEASVPADAYWATIVLKYEGRRGTLFLLRRASSRAAGTGCKRLFPKVFHTCGKGACGTWMARTIL